jgi:hypothetical protein
MARIGRFTGMASGPYGAALSTVHPIDNVMTNPNATTITTTTVATLRTMVLSFAPAIR